MNNNNLNSKQTNFLISNKELEKLMFLAKIEIKDSEKDFFVNQLQLIQDNVLAKIHQIDCASFEPLITVHEIDLSLADDIENKRNTTDDIFSMTPLEVKHNSKTLQHLLVQKVIS